MFEKLKEKLKLMMTAPAPFDPARFGDPLALHTEWTPAKCGGTNIRTHKLSTIGPSRVEFRATIGARIFYLVFLFAGLGVFAAIAVPWFNGVLGSRDLGLLVPFGLSLIFIAVGSTLLYTGTAPIVFEKGRSVFWKGRKGPDEAIGGGNTGSFVRLEQVHALQLIPEYISGKSSYYSYELNLVLEDGKRVCVIDHGNLDRLREDAKTLALFLGKPLWDATLR